MFDPCFSSISGCVKSFQKYTGHKYFHGILVTLLAFRFARSTFSKVILHSKHRTTCLFVRFGSKVIHLLSLRVISSRATDDNRTLKYSSFRFRGSISCLLQLRQNLDVRAGLGLQGPHSFNSSMSISRLKRFAFESSSLLLDADSSCPVGALPSLLSSLIGPSKTNSYGFSFETLSSSEFSPTSTSSSSMSLQDVTDSNSNRLSSETLSSLEINSTSTTSFLMSSRDVTELLLSDKVSATVNGVQLTKLFSPKEQPSLEELGNVTPHILSSPFPLYERVHCRLLALAVTPLHSFDVSLQQKLDPNSFANRTPTIRFFTKHFRQSSRPPATNAPQIHRPSDAPNMVLSSIFYRYQCYVAKASRPNTV